MWVLLAGAQRLIPAYAGSTSSRPRWCAVAPAHPRLRGEHLMVNGPNCVMQGSSPLTRGAHHLCPHGHYRDGLIPAYAGSTFRAQLHGATPGLIPAYAGSTKLRTDESEPPPAHPRLRGEHKRGYLRRWPCSGSSPLTRGARSRLAFLEVVCGLIPAYAGSTHHW